MAVSHKAKNRLQGKDIAALLKRGATGPDMSELALHFFDIAGGTRAVARLLWEEYSLSKPGSLARTRILDLVIWMTKILGDRAGPEQPLDLLADDDLELLLREALKKVADDESSTRTRPEATTAAGTTAGTPSSTTGHVQRRAATPTSPRPPSGRGGSGRGKRAPRSGASRQAGSGSDAAETGGPEVI